MKKIISTILLLAMVVFAAVSCSPAVTPDPDPAPSVEKDYTLGIGVAMDIDGTEVNSTVAAVVTDADGKIVLCRIDAITSEAKLNADGTPAKEALVSKYELGDNYNMVAYGGAIAEWYKQAEAFETYVVGKTLNEVKNIALDENDKPTGTDLVAGCTIAVSDFIVAIGNAIESDDKLGFKASGDIKAAVSVNAELTADANTLSFSTTFDYAAAVSEAGKVVAALVDSADVTLACTKDADNKLTLSTSVYDGTKLEQGDDYNMVAYGGAISEWYVQATTFAATAVGKDAASLDTLPTENIAGCTIGVDAYKAALVKAGKSVR